MKRYIDDFVEDLNYRKVILYIGNLDSDSLRSKMESDNMGHTNRFATVMANHLMYVETAICKMLILGMEMNLAIVYYTLWRKDMPFIHCSMNRNPENIL